jgi:hypothetical protein
MSVSSYRLIPSFISRSSSYLSQKALPKAKATFSPGRQYTTARIATREAQIEGSGHIQPVQTFENYYMPKAIQGKHYKGAPTSVEDSLRSLLGLWAPVRTLERSTTVLETKKPSLLQLLRRNKSVTDTRKFSLSGKLSKNSSTTDLAIPADHSRQTPLFNQPNWSAPDLSSSSSPFRVPTASHHWDEAATNVPSTAPSRAVSVYEHPGLGGSWEHIPSLSTTPEPISPISRSGSMNWDLLDDIPTPHTVSRSPSIDWHTETPSWTPSSSSDAVHLTSFRMPTPQGPVKPYASGFVAYPSLSAPIMPMRERVQNELGWQAARARARAGA